MSFYPRTATLRLATSLFFALSAFTSQSALSLGLGEIVLNSTTGQPLDAHIPLSQLDNLFEDDITASIASRDDFQLVGISMSRELDLLEFTTDYSSGAPQISITTLDPVESHYLNLLVDVQWPTGRLLREYTLNLKEVIFSDAATMPISSVLDATESNQAAITASRQQPASGFQVQHNTKAKAKAENKADDFVTEPMFKKTAAKTYVKPTPKPTPDVKPEPAKPTAKPRIVAFKAPPPKAATPKVVAPKPKIAAPKASQKLKKEPSKTLTQQPKKRATASTSDEAKRYRVRSGDTLWAIAAKMQSGTSMIQRMNTIHESNPQAFIRGDINLLKKGVTLMLPSSAGTLSTEQVEQATSANRKSKKGAFDKIIPGAANNNFQDEPTNRPATNSAGYLSLSNNDGGHSLPSAARGPIVRADVTRGEVNSMHEELDRSLRQNDELEGVVVNLQEQLTTMQKLMELQNEQMLQLQESLSQNNQPQGLLQENPENQSVSAEETPWYINAFFILLALALIVGIILLLLKGNKRSHNNHSEI